MGIFQFHVSELRGVRVTFCFKVEKKIIWQKTTKMAREKKWDGPLYKNRPSETGPRSEVLFRHHLHESSEWHRNLGRFMDLSHDSWAQKFHHPPPIQVRSLSWLGLGHSQKNVRWLVVWFRKGKPIPIPKIGPKHNIQVKDDSTPNAT